MAIATNIVMHPIAANEAYFTLVLPRTVPEFTNVWNNLDGYVGGPEWTSQTRGAFRTELAACEWARDHLKHGAPFSVRLVPAVTDEEG